MKSWKLIVLIGLIGLVVGILGGAFWHFDIGYRPSLKVNYVKYSTYSSEEVFFEISNNRNYPATIRKEILINYKENTTERTARIASSQSDGALIKIGYGETVLVHCKLDTLIGYNEWSGKPSAYDNLITKLSFFCTNTRRYFSLSENDLNTINKLLENGKARRVEKTARRAKEKAENQKNKLLNSQEDIVD